MLFVAVALISMPQFAFADDGADTGNQASPTTSTEAIDDKADITAPEAPKPNDSANSDDAPDDEPDSQANVQDESGESDDPGEPGEPGDLEPSTAGKIDEDDDSDEAEAIPPGQGTASESTIEYEHDLEPIPDSIAVNEPSAGDFPALKTAPATTAGAAPEKESLPQREPARDAANETPRQPAKPDSEPPCQISAWQPAMDQMSSCDAPDTRCDAAASPAPGPNAFTFADSGLPFGMPSAPPETEIATQHSETASPPSLEALPLDDASCTSLQRTSRLRCGGAERGTSRACGPGRCRSPSRA